MRSRTKRMRQYYSQMNNYESHKGLFQKPLKSKVVQKIIELKNKKFVEAEQLSKMTSYRDSRATGLGENSREEITPIHDILNEVERPRRAGSRNPKPRKASGRAINATKILEHSKAVAAGCGYANGQAER